MRLRRAMKGVHKTAPMLLDPWHCGVSDWVLDRKNQNPFRAKTVEWVEYEKGFERGRSG